MINEILMVIFVIALILILPFILNYLFSNQTRQNFWNWIKHDKKN